MRYDEFIGQVRHRARLGSHAEAERATRATLEILAERLASGEAHDLASQLPPELARYLEAPDAGIGAKLTLDEFFELVSEREGVDLPDATFHGRVVIGVLTEAVSLGEIQDVRVQLPAAFAQLFNVENEGDLLYLFTKVSSSRRYVSTTPFLPLPDGLDITSISESPDALLVQVTSRCTSSACPLCGEPSQAIHSYYQRKPMDLPCAGRAIRLLLTVRKFFCRKATCSRKVFTERLTALLEPSSRLTTRLRKAVQEIGLATCGKGGERLCPKLGIDLSDATLLWSLHLLPIPPVGKVRVIGLDDWSWRRGQRHGTIVVDLERHQVLDLLPDRRSETVKRWLEQHPEIEIVSRDRAIDRDGNLVDSLGSREAGDGGSQAL